MRDVLLKEILSEYQVIRQRGEHELRAREAEVFKKIPEILSLRNNMYSLLAEHSKNQILKPSTTVNMEELSNQIAILKDKELTLLMQEGYPNDYLMLQFRCPVCQDTGYVGDPVLEKCRHKCLGRSYTQSLRGLPDKSCLSNFCKQQNPRSASPAARCCH